MRGIDLEVADGEVVLIVGPSGSGKTTLLLMLGAMLRPTAGTIVLDGIDVAQASERRLPALRARHLGFVFLQPPLRPHRSGERRAGVQPGRSPGGRPARARATELLERVGLAERLSFRPDQLSGGEKQRVAIARALANDPAVILADEPTANLDSGHGQEIARLLRRLAHEDRRSIVMVSHDERLKEVADRVLWLEDGTFRTLASMATNPICGMTVTTGGGPHSCVRV